MDQSVRPGVLPLLLVGAAGGLLSGMFGIGGGTIIVPTYMNRSEQGKTSGFVSTVGKAGADFKRQFTFDTYKQFIAAAGYDDVDYAYCPGRVPCAVAVIHKP